MIKIIGKYESSIKFMHTLQPSTIDKVTRKTRLFSLGIVHHVHANFSPLNPLHREIVSYS